MKKCIQKHNVLVLALVVLIGAVLSGCGGGASNEGGGTTNDVDNTAANTTVKELRLSAMAVEGEIAYDVCTKIVEEINSKSETIHVTLYPADQLGDWSVVFNEVMMGTIDMAQVSIPDTYDPKATACYIPYLATDYSKLEELIGEGSWICDVMRDSMKGMGVEYIGVILDGISGIATTKPVKDPTDPTKDKGILIRSSATLATKLAAESVGFRTSIIPFSDTYAAMQSGVIDGCIAAPPGSTYLSFGEVMKYWYDYRSTAEVTGLVASAKSLETLSETDRKIVRDALQQGSALSFEQAQAFNEEYLQIMRDKGIEVVTFTEDELASFAKNSREKYWPQMEELLGEDFFVELNRVLEELGLD